MLTLRAWQVVHLMKGGWSEHFVYCVPAMLVWVDLISGLAWLNISDQSKGYSLSQSSKEQVERARMFLLFFQEYLECLGQPYVQVDIQPITGYRR